MVKHIKSCRFDYAASVYAENPADFKLNTLNIHNFEWIVKGALDFIDQNKDNHFFLYMATTLHHDPPPLESLLSADERITPAGLLERPLKVMSPRSSIVERVKSA